MSPHVRTRLSVRFFPRWVGNGVLAGILLVVGPFQTAVWAQGDAKHPKELSDRVDDGLAKLQPLADGKKWDEALALVNGLLVGSDPESFDMAYLLDVKAKIYLQEDDYHDALQPSEEALRLGEKYNYFSSKNILDDVYGLATFYYVESTTSKDPQVQHEDLVKATVYIKRWLDTSPKPTQEAALFYSELLYSRAVSDPNKIDTVMLHQAMVEAIRGLHTSLTPKEGFYQIIVAALQEDQNWTEFARYLELMVTKYPTNKGYWQSLAGAYLNLAVINEDAKNEYETQVYYARATNTIERAQELGFLKDPKTNYDLFTTYFNAGQSSRAVELLEEGLDSGAIESTVKNWELLSTSYEQANKYNEAIQALKQGEQSFPNSGQLDADIGGVYAQLDNNLEAYKAYSGAIAKGNVNDPFQAYSAVAYYAFQIGKLDEAIDAANRAHDLPKGKKDHNLSQLRRAIRSAIAAKQHTVEAQDHPPELESTGTGN